MNTDDTPTDIKIRRLLRKIEKRDKRNAGLLNRISQLESALATKDVEIKRLPREVARAVQEALCNVRMIPVLGVGKNARIIEVKSSEA